MRVPLEGHPFPRVDRKIRCTPPPLQENMLFFDESLVNSGSEADLKQNNNNNSDFEAPG